MSISSFNLSYSKSRNTLHTQYTSARSFPSNCAGFRQRQRLTGPTLHTTTTTTRSIFGIKIRANNRLHSHSRSEIEDRTSRRDAHGEESARWSGTKSHSHSVELDAINVIININNVIGHKKKTMKRSPNQAPPSSLSQSSPSMIV